MVPAFRLLSDGGQHVIRADPDQITSFAEFRRLASRFLRFTSDSPVFCSSSPRVTDLAVCGQACKAILVASEKVIRLPTPPGRLSLYTPIAFLDCRRILQGFSWIAVERGLLDLEQVNASFQDTAPDGYSPNLRGADTEIRLGRTYLRVTFGTLLTVTYVANGDESDDDSSLLSSGPSSDGNPEDAAPAGNLDDGDTAANTPPRRRASSHSRSRSPRPPADNGGDGHDHVCYDSTHTESCATKSDNQSWLASAKVSLEVCLSIFPRLSMNHAVVSLECSYGLPSMLSGFVQGERKDLGFGPSPFFSRCKLLHEPQSSTPALSHLVAGLRRATTRLGLPWRYAAAEDDMLIEDDDEAASTHTASSEELTLLHFVLLSPGRTAKHIAFQHILPATLAEILAQLQAERRPDDRSHFSCVIPASPQPSPGSGVLLALPSWWRTDMTAPCFLCLDVTAIDGRIFTAASPCYVSRRHLLHLADLPLESDIAVHMKDDFWPLPDEAQYHAITGDTFLFLPRGAVAPTLHELGQELLSPRAWSPALTVPAVEVGQHLCLVHENETILCQPTSNSPMMLHAQIAACIGSSRQHLRLFPSNPRINDAALHGVPCRAVLSVCIPQGPLRVPFHGVIIDARAALAGWRSYQALAGRFSCHAVLVDLQHTLPIGWQAGFQGVPPGVDLIDVTPGQVLTVSIEPAPHHGPVAAPASADAPDHRTSTQGTSGPPRASPGQAAASESLARNPIPDAYESHDVARAPHENPFAQRTSSFLTRVFLVLGQNYLPETIEVRLPATTTTELALEQVAASRHPRDAYLLPRLIAVQPQPCASHALILAAPAWPITGALVAFDCRSIGGSVFALQLCGSLTRQELLRAAQIDAGFRGDIYVGNLPWALGDGIAIPLEHGDLVLFQPPQARYHSVADLDDMLQSSAGWRSAFDPAEDAPARTGHHIWIISEQEEILLRVEQERRHQLRSDIARSLSVTTDRLFLQRAHLPLNDLFHRGTHAQHVFAASRELLPAGATGTASPTVCFVDARPLMLTLGWIQCPLGSFDSAPLVTRYASRCPVGWELWLLRSDLRREPIGGLIAVQPGDTFIVCFGPQLGPFAPAAPPPDQGRDDGDEPEDGPGDPAAGGHNDMPPRSPSAPVTSGPSDTGGTLPVSHDASEDSEPPSATLPEHGTDIIGSVLPASLSAGALPGFPMWRSGPFHGVRPADPLTLTPGYPSTILNPTPERCSLDRLSDAAPCMRLAANLPLASWSPLALWCCWDDAVRLGILFEAALCCVCTTALVTWTSRRVMSYLALCPIGAWRGPRLAISCSHPSPCTSHTRAHADRLPTTNQGSHGRRLCILIAILVIGDVVGVQLPAPGGASCLHLPAIHVNGEHGSPVELRPQVELPCKRPIPTPCRNARTLAAASQAPPQHCKAAMPPANVTTASDDDLHSLPLCLTLRLPQATSGHFWRLPCLRPSLNTRARHYAILAVVFQMHPPSALALFFSWTG